MQIDLHTLYEPPAPAIVRLIGEPPTCFLLMSPPVRMRMVDIGMFLSYFIYITVLGSRATYIYITSYDFNNSFLMF
jgi:hypothetical protein